MFATIQRLAIGSSAALVLHALLLLPLASGGHPRHTTTSQLEMIAVWIPSDSSAVPNLPPLTTDAQLSPVRPEIEATQIDLNEAVADTAGAVPPYIRYVGLVTSRIARAWIVPTANRAGDFHCRARIRRGPDGEVQDLALQPCDRDPALEASVRKAIRLATPLPARPETDNDPPTDSLTLDFTVFAVATQGRSSSVQPGTTD